MRTKRELQLKLETNPVSLLTASTSLSIDVCDLSRISCIRSMSYLFTICSNTQVSV